MATIQELYTQSTLSLAAYAKNLADGTLNDPDQQNALKEAGMSEAQAEDFASKWTVVKQYTDPLNNFPSGLSATVFQNMESGQKCLAFRGTEFDVDLLVDIVLGALGLHSVNPQYATFYFVLNNWLANGVLSGDFTVTGHSLGGYLAVA
jgi:hypothetical protein